MNEDLEFNIKDIEDIEDIVDPNDGIEAVEIDLESISKEAGQYANSLVENLTEFYYNNEFFKNNTPFRRHVESDIDALKVLIKMRKSDEITHDILVKAISNNPGNASLYRSLTDVQRTILNIQSKIDETIKSLNTFMKGYQTEIDFDKKEEVDEGEVEEQHQVLYKGSKDFIEEMRKSL